MTREQILDAAAQIFGQKGYHAASMQDIARAVNLQKASLYHHVDSKQEILLALLDRALDLLIARIEGVLQQDISIEMKLRLAMGVYLQTLTDNRALSAVLLFEHRSLKSNLRERHLPRRDRFESLWRRMIREGTEQGVFECQYPDQIARALLGVMNWTLTWYRTDGPFSPTEIANQYADLFLNGLLTRQQQTKST